MAHCVFHFSQQNFSRRSGCARRPNRFAAHATRHRRPLCLNLPGLCVLQASAYRERWESGQSTLLWAKYTQTFGGSVISCGRDPAALAALKAELKIYADVLDLVAHAGGAARVLASLHETIDLLYVGGTDFPWLMTHTNEFDPVPSQQQVLAEVKAALPLLGPKAVVLLDDCGVAYGGPCAYVFVLLRGPCFVIRAALWERDVSFFFTGDGLEGLDVWIRSNESGCRLTDSS